MSIQCMEMIQMSFQLYKKFIKQGELVIALISKSYIGREATFKIDQEGKMGR